MTTAGVIQAPLRLAGMLADWDFTGAPPAQRGQLFDTSRNAFNGSIVGSPAVIYDGAGDFSAVAVPWDELGAGGGNRYAIWAGWVYADAIAPATAKVLWIDSWNAGNAPKLIIFHSAAGAGEIRAGVRTGAAGDDFRSADSVQAITAAAWHHVAVQVDAAAETVTYWIDGVFETPVALSGALAQTTWATDVSSAQQAGEHANGSGDFAGRTTDMRYLGSNTPITQAQVQALYDFPYSAVDGLAWGGHWRMNEAAGGPQDYSGNAHHMALVNAGWDIGTNLGQSWIGFGGGQQDRFQGGGMELNSAMVQHVNVDNIAATLGPLTGFTVAAWFRYNDTGTEQVIFSLADASDAESRLKLDLDAWNEDEIRAVIVEAGAAIRVAAHNNAVVDDASAIICAIFATDATGNSLYVNGVEDTTDVIGDDDTDASPSVIGGVDSVLLGAGISAGTVELALDGALERIDLFSRRLTVPEIISLTNRGPRDG